ncbi:polyprenyl synthetase family protein [Oceanobacillus bengalensis]|uniref:Farnesyl diphosphate synthase n=1 Tax=Oceanobacillus bengalensis TaxID=1435466 RepID=A0A494Z185_9BACI|nr:farnesyl diphosphate synthase [Oceanobacillus bengalensis]RKQ16055.1 polyprenyl synthetase family protein [Oceanobacillus bengalensis]
MSRELIGYIENSKELLQEALHQSLQKLLIPEQLKQSMLYSINAGGKRLRPILLMASYDAYANNNKKVLSSCLAVEMIHTYSLIHDDLPAMDNDDYRRGKPTNHKVFDESTAILAGDALLTYSFEIIAEDPLLNDTQKVEIIRLLSACGGPTGMVGGQILDMEAEKKSATLEELERIHTLKTGELIRFAIYTGAYLANASKEQLNYLTDFAYYLGLIFQVQDDILDVTGDEKKLGKRVGSDQENEKSTYPKLLGIGGAMKQKEIYVEKAKNALEKANAEDSYLMALTDYFSNRDY